MSETCDRFEMESIAVEHHQHHHRHQQLNVRDRGRDTSDSSDDNDSDFDSNDKNQPWTDDGSTSNSSFDSDRLSIVSTVSTTQKTELNKQHELRNNLSIVGLPHVKSENLRAMFLKVCKLLGAPTTNDAIRHIWRDTARQVINIELRDHDVKAHICRFSHAKYLWTDDLIRLPAGMVRSRIYINDQMTHFYKQMWEIGRQARKNHLIYTSWISDHGFMVKRTAASKKRYFLSAVELNRFIDQLRKMKRYIKTKKTATASTRAVRNHRHLANVSTARGAKRRRLNSYSR